MTITFFRLPSNFRNWLKKHHASATELWVGFYKKGSGKPSITWPESIDEALCFGWIDGIRKSVDDISYKVRFTPRNPKSAWSPVNIKRAQVLIDEGRMEPAGLKAFEVRRETRSGIYTYEGRRDQLEEPYASLLRKDKAAWEFFQAQPPSYRKAAGWFVLSAKKEETRLQRVEKLIELSRQGKRLI